MTHTGLPDATLDQLVAVFSAHPEIQKVTLFGSRAKGTHHQGSDVDLSVKAPDWSSRELAALMMEIDDLNLPWLFDIHLDHLIHLPALREHIRRVGVILFPLSELRNGCGNDFRTSETP